MILFSKRFCFNLIKTMSLSIVFLMQSCSSQKLGQQLSNNFDYPQTEISSSNLKEGSKRVDKDKQKKIFSTKLQNKPNKNFISDSSAVGEKAKLKKQKPNNPSKKILRKIKFKPQPYRITIKLSGANPSAPAESVTKALRQAGINFEVEKIERFNAQSDMKTSSTVER
ncbi:hypothetical protein [Prochlorococcus sp. MIT 1223]|uniref:hypothetical protein n=1 Tax=Prochlorococcus sp. MIT 1223 TaxID=3096217 RepID=UPI002A765886|nr:hypothetical protein [Prochlorococcus sp. MIT 1223]